MDDRFIKKLISNMKCSVCGRPYDVGKVNVLGHKEDVWFLSVSCVACSSRGLVAAIVTEGKVSTIATDLTEAERDRLADIPPVSVDEVLDMRIFLREFSGDIAHLLCSDQEHRCNLGEGC